MHEHIVTFQMFPLRERASAVAAVRLFGCGTSGYTLRHMRTGVGTAGAVRGT